MRESGDEFKDGQLWNGFDYTLQCWVKDGKVLNCGHTLLILCDCFGRRYAGAELSKVKAVSI